MTPCRVHVPTDTIVTLNPLTVQTPVVLLVSATVNPDVDDAVTGNGVAEY